jgi:hypothetical protein
MDLESEVKAIVEKEHNEKIKSIKEEVYCFIKEHNGNVDSVYVACKFSQFPCNITCLAISILEDEGRIERLEAEWNIQPYRLFVR